MKSWFPLAVLSILALGVVGCAAIRESNAGQTEKLLVASGFQARPANTAQKQAALNALTPYKVQMRTRGANVYYVYADPQQNVVYVGGPAEYSAYQKVSVQQDLASEQQMAAAQMQMNELEWNYWGPWNSFGGPPILN